MPELEIYTTEPLTIGEYEVCDDEYDPKMDDSDMSESELHDIKFAKAIQELPGNFKRACENLGM